MSDVALNTDKSTEGYLYEVVQLLDALIDYCGCDLDEVEYERAVIKQLCEKYGWTL